MSAVVKNIADKAQLLVDSNQYLDLIEGLDPNDPWSTDSLDQAESCLLANHADLSEEQKEAYQLFLGEGLRRQFGGEWSSAQAFDPTYEDAAGVIGILYPQGYMDVVSSLLDNAIAFNIGNSWSAIYETTEQIINQGLE